MLYVNRRALFAALAAATPALAFAADPWTKPPSQWGEKDIQKILTDSPWAKTVSIPFGAAPMGGGGGGRGGRGGRGGGMGGAIPDASSSSSMGGEPLGGGPGMGGPGGMGAGAAPSLSFHIRWQSATPIKAANIRARLGAEADSSPQAKAFVEREEREYVIAVIMPAMRMPGAENRPGAPTPAEEAVRKGPGAEAAERLKQSTWLAWKNHEPLHPASVNLPQAGQAPNVVVFHFPKDHPIELEDKEVEFYMRRGPMEVRKKFKLKDMVFEGKLAL